MADNSRSYYLIFFFSLLFFGASFLSKGQDYTLVNPKVVSTFPFTDFNINTEDGETGIGMQGTCSAIPCCSLYVYKVVLPSTGALRMEMSNFSPLNGSIIAYRSSVAVPGVYSDLTYISATPGNFCGFRDSLQLGRGTKGWGSVPYGQVPQPSGLTQVYDFNNPTSSAGYFPAGDYYVVVFNVNNQFNQNNGALSDLTFEFAEACAPLTAPSLLSFGSVEQNTGKDTLDFYIKNERQLDVQIDPNDVVLGGSNAAMFSISTYPSSTLVVGDSTKVSLVFQPTSGGTKTASLDIGFSDTSCTASSTINISGIGSEADIVISGNGISITNNDASPSINDFTNFGAIVNNTGSLTKTFKIHNHGADTLVLSGSPKVNLVGSSSFVVTSFPANSILPGDSSSFTIVFTPTNIGIETVDLTIINNDVDKSNYQFKLSGTGAGLNGLVFDGSGDYISFDAISSSMVGVTTFTFETWLKVPNSQSGNDQILAVNTSSNGSRMFFLIDDGKLEFHVGSNSKLISSQDIRDDTWHNLVFSFNNGILISYLDGVPISTISNNVPSFSSSDKWSIGQEFDNGGPSDYLLATMDEFRFWKTVRTHQEILDSRYCEISNPSSDLLAYYTFNQGVPDGNNTSLTELTDWSGNGFNGVINGFALTGTSSNFTATSNVGTNCTSLSPAVCDASNYTSPSGKIYSVSGLYKDTISKISGGDSLFYIDLRLNFKAYSQSSLSDTALCIGDTLIKELNTNLVSTTKYELSNGDWTSLEGLEDSLINTNRSIFMWMKAAGQVSGTQQVLIGINTSGTSTVTNFGIATNEQLWINDGGSNRNSGITVTDGNWHFVGYTYDEGSNLTTFYVDGIAGNTFSNGQSISATSRISIGQEFDGTTASNFFDGDITEISFWNEVLDINDINSIMGEAIQNSNVKYNNLIAYYPSNANCSDDLYSLRDFSGNDFHGRLSNPDILNRDSLISLGVFSSESHFNFDLSTGGSSVHSENPTKFSIPSTGNYEATLKRDFFEINDSFIITSGSGCSSALVLNINLDSNANCNGTSSGGATATASGGTAPYTYSWSNSATTATISGLGAGTYNLTLTDDVGASTSSSITISEPAVLNVSTALNSNATCNGSIDGGATASATGGTAPYTYLWSNSATTASIVGVSAGTYNITITDANGCAASGSIIVSEPTSLTASVVVNNNASTSGASDGSLTGSASGGTAPYTYLWSNAATTATISGLVAGNYPLTITDANGCTSNSSGLVLEGATALSLVIIVDSNVSCNGLSDGGASATVNGGTAPYTYLWSNSATTRTITGLSFGTYNLTVTDNVGASTSNSVSITEPTILNASAVIDNNVSCNGSSDGGATASATGGTAPYTYLWSNSATTASIAGVSAGTFNVTITDVNGCAASSSAIINEPTSLSASVVVNNNASTSGASDGSLTASATGGTMPYTYLWSNVATTATISGLVAGNYTLTVTDAKGCTANSSGLIIDGAVPLNLVMVVDSNVSCNGFSDGGASASISGGVAPYSYLWTNSATTSSITGLTSGTYSLTATDNDGTTITNSITIAEPSLLQAASIVNNNVTCYGGSDGSATGSATGGTAPYTYLWSNAAITASIVGVSTGDYLLSITDANGCTASSMISITEPLELTSTILADSMVSCQSLSDGGASVSANGGTAPYTYLWSNSATMASLVGVPSGKYFVSLTDANGCSTIDSIVITEPQSLNAGISLTSNESCLGIADGSLSSSPTGGTAPYSYLWSNATTNSTISNLAAGSYQLTVTDANGCSISASTNVLLLDTVLPLVYPKNINAYLDANGSVSVTANQVDSASFDACGIDSLSLSKYDFNCSEIGANTIWLFAKDNSDNVDSAMAVVSILDTVKPLVITQNFTSYLNSSGSTSISENDINNGSSDACSIQTFSISKSSFSCSDLGTNSIWLKATDVNGNSDSSIAIVTILDTILPIAKAKNSTFYLDANGSVSISGINIDNGSSDNCGISLSADINNFTCSDLGLNLITLTATDIAGNSNSTTTLVTIRDTIHPTAVSQNVTIQLGADGKAIITPQMIDNSSSDNCTFSLSLDKTNFTCADLGTNTVVLTATDIQGHSHSTSASVTVEDNIAPTILSQNIGIQLNAAGIAVITPSLVNSGSFDNCGTVSLSLSQDTFSCSDLGVNAVVFTVDDGNGQAITSNVLITVQDLLAPIAMSRNVTAYLDASGNAQISPSDIDNASTDNCGVSSLSISQTDFDCSETGNNSIILFVSDAGGNTSTANATVHILDSISPQITGCPADINLSTDPGQCSAIVNWTAPTVSDNCTGTTLSSSHTSGSAFPIGTSTVVYTSTDASGNSSSCSFTIHIVDNEAPVLNCLADMLVNNDPGNCDAVVNYSMVGSDNCTANISISQIAGLASGSTFPNGATINTFVALDAVGNSDTCSFVITVVDAEAPVTSCPSDANLSNDIGQCAAIYSYTIPFTDNCSGSSIIQTAGLASGSLFPVGITSNTFVVTDAAGNSTSCSFNVSVSDTSLPTFVNTTANITVYSDASNCDVTASWSASTATDNCTSNPIINISHNTGSIFPKGVTPINITATDASGNSKAYSFTVTVLDTISPVFANAPTVFTSIPSTTSCNAQVNWLEPTVIDNCSAITLVKSHLPGSVFNVGSTTVIYTATDIDGNSSTLSFVVQVNDVIAPVFTSVPANIAVSNDAGNCDASVNYSAPVATDNCGTVNMVNSHPSGTIFPVGITTVNLVATDNAGNSSNASFTVTVTDNEAPIVATVPAGDTVGICDASYVYALPSGTDNCSAVTITQQAGLPSGSFFPVGTTVNVFQLKDAVGNQVLVSFPITVLAQEYPSLVYPSSICQNENDIDLVLGQNNLSFAGNGVLANMEIFSPRSAGQGNHNITYTYTDVNGCTTNGTFNILVLATPTKPVIIQTASTTLNTGAYASYQWYRDGIEIFGANQQTYEFSQQGNYQVYVSNLQACEDYSDGWVIGQANGGIGLEETKISRLNLFPNPTKNVLNIEVPKNFNEELIIEVYSNTGALMIRKSYPKVEGELIQLELGELSNAFYHIRLIHQGQLLGSEIIILDK